MDDGIEIRCFLGLPADGRKIISEIAENMLFNELPDIVDKSLVNANIDQKAFKYISKWQKMPSTLA